MSDDIPKPEVDSLLDVATDVVQEIKEDIPIVTEEVEGITDEAEILANKLASQGENVVGNTMTVVADVINDGIEEAKMKDSLTSVKEEIKTAEEKLGDMLGVTSISVTNKVSELVEEVKDYGNNLEEQAEELLENVQDSAESVVQEVTEEIQEKVGDIINIGAEDPTHIKEEVGVPEQIGQNDVIALETKNQEEEAVEENEDTDQNLDPTIKLIKSKFRLFDYSGDGTISVEDLGNLLRCLNMNPTLAEIDQVAAQLQNDAEGPIEFRYFVPKAIELIDSGSFRPLPETKLLEAFQALDIKRKGMISVKRLRSIMTQIGEPLSDVEMDDLLADIGDRKSGEVDYAKYVKKLLNDD